MPSPAENRSQREIREEAMVIAAAQLFLKNHIDDVKMTDIAELAGVGVASVYRYFGTKDALLIRVGTFLWSDLQTLFGSVYGSEEFGKKNGFGKISELLGIYKTLFRDHPGFVRFVAEFDSFIIASKVDRSALAEYESRVLDFYPVFLSSYEAGIADGSVKRIPSPELYYTTVCHGVFSLAQKLLRGEILPGDGFSGTVEVDYLIDMAADYLRNDRKG